jgi:DNA-binding protein YbaB
MPGECATVIVLSLRRNLQDRLRSSCGTRVPADSELEQGAVVFDFDPHNFQLEDLNRIIGQSQEVMRNLEKVQDALGEVTGEGEAADGMVRAVVTGTGGIQQVTLEPRAMRLDSQSLAENVTLAVRAAQTDAQSKTTQLLGSALGGVDLAEDALDQDKVREQLQSVQDSFGRKIDERSEEFLRRQQRM